MKIFLSLLLLICFEGTAFAQQDEQESDLKAAFIYNFTRYIDWNINPDENEFVIGIIGQSPIINSLEDIAKSSLVKNKRIRIRYFNKPDDIDSCNILFITQKNSFSLQSILSKLSKGTLTISEQPGYAKQGTAFNFVLVNDKLKFEANLKTINSQGLKASSQLLKLAILVE